MTGARRQCWVVGEGPDRYCNKLCYSRQLLTVGLDFSTRKMGAWPASFSGYCESRGTGHRKYYSKCFQSIRPWWEPCMWTLSCLGEGQGTVLPGRT